MINVRKGKRMNALALIVCSTEALGAYFGRLFIRELFIWGR